MSVCGSAPQRHRAKHHCCHQQPRRELRQQHGSHGTVNNCVHSLVAMEALEATSTAAEVDPDLMSKIGARHDTRNRRAPPPVPTAMVGADFRIMTTWSLDKWYTFTVPTL
jgi:hypothetical protein